MNASKKRICQVLHGIVGGGSEQVVLNYCSRMHDIHFDLLYQYEPNPQILERFNEARIHCIRLPDKVHHPLKHLWTMFKIFHTGRYDVVHSHLDWYMNSYTCLLAMLAGVKKRFAHHHQAYHPDNLFLKLVCALLRVPCKLFATHWLACGEVAAVNGWGMRAVKKGRVTILPNAIDPKQFKFSGSTRQKIRSQLGINDNDFVIGHVGRFYPEKNHNFLLDVFYEVHKQLPNTKLLLLGDGPLQDTIRQKIESLDIVNSVIFAGLQKNPAPFYNAMDVFCFPSLREGLGIVLIEAQYNGLTCVASDFVPSEVRISNNFHSLSLSRPPREWSDFLLKFSKRTQEEFCLYSVFDINTTYVQLQRLYSE